MFLRQIHKGGLQFWQFLLTIVLVILGYLFGQMPLTLVLFYYNSKNGGTLDSLNEVVESMDFSAVGMPHNLTLFLMLLMFVMAMIGLYVGVVKFHKRDFKTIWTGRRKIDYSRILFAFLVWISIAILSEFVSYLITPDNYVLTLEWQPFLILLIICLTLLPVQTTFEELFVRGYLMQAFGLVFHKRWMPIVVTSMIFGGLHMMNPEVREFGLGTMMFYYVGIAVFLGVLTLLDDGLELAIGVHAATNIYGALLVNFEESAIQSPSLIKMVDVNANSMTVFSFVGAVIFFVIVQKRFGPFRWSRITGSVFLDDKVEELEDLKSGKIHALTSQFSEYQDRNDSRLQELDSEIKFFERTGKGYLLMTQNAAPFKVNGRVQIPFQLGYYELFMATKFSAIDEENTPDYQSVLGREARMLRSIARESRHRAFLSYRAYKQILEDGQKIYFVMQPFPDTQIHNIDGWKIGGQLITEITAKQYELAKSQGAQVLIRQLRNMTDFPFISNPETAL